MTARDQHDHYPTPPNLISAALDTLPATFTPARILDPGAGGGGWGTAARRRWPHARLIGIELRSLPRPDAYDAWSIADFLTTYPDPVDLIIGNPPFSLALGFTRHALGLLRPGGYLVFLLRLSFLGALKRRAFWHEHPPQRVHVVVPRPSFTCDGGTDSAEYGLFVWRRAPAAPVTLDWLDWRQVEQPAMQEVLL